MKAVVITGVSTGIGHATARILLKNGFRVFGSVRKQEDIDRLFKEFGSSFMPLLFDVTNQDAIRVAAQHVRSQLNGEMLYGLVNNAGIAVTGPLLHVSTEDLRHQLDVNLVSLLAVTQAFVPLLGADRSLRGNPGRLINMGSVSGKQAYPFIGPYTISKFGLEGFTDTLRLELALYGIAVVLISPGPIATPMYQKGVSRNVMDLLKTDFAKALHKSRDYYESRRKKALPPERVGEAVLKALTASRPKLRYVVVSRRFKDWILPRLFPKRMVAAALSKKFGLSPN